MWDWLFDKDFANYWIAARLVLNGQVADLFGEHAAYFRHMTEAFGPDYPWHNWSYPPHFLLLIWPLGLMPYGVALVVFMAVTFGLYAVAVPAFLKRRPVARDFALILPFVIANVLTMQNGFLTGALLLGGLALRERRPLLAGVLIGLLTIKPQLGIMLPFLLLIERRWRVILSAAVTALLLVALSAGLFGTDAWHGYVTQSLPYQKGVMMQGRGIFTAMMPSTFMSLRRMGLASETALALHMMLAAGAVVLALFAMWKIAEPGRRAAIMLLATYVATPYWLTYDFGAAAAAIALVASTRSEESRTGRVLGPILLLLAALVPLISVPLVINGYYFTPVLVLAAFILAMAPPGRVLAQP